MRVLLIDDEKTIRRGMELLFDQLEFDITIVGEARNGEEGLKKIELLQPDYAFIDVQMPIMDGIELVKNWKEKAISPCTKCIMLTAYSEFEYAQKSLRYGVHDYLLKPIDENILNELFYRLNEAEIQQEPIADTGDDIIQSYKQKRAISHPFIMDILYLVSKNYKRNLQLSEIARKLHVTPSYISSQFKKVTGDNFVTFLNYYRIEIAKSIIIENPHYKIGEIAYMVGFNNITYFNKVFKSITGTTPHLYLREKGIHN